MRVWAKNAFTGGVEGFALAAFFAHFASTTLRGVYGNLGYLQDRNDVWQFFFSGGNPNEVLNFTQQVTWAFLLFGSWWMLWKFDGFFRPVPETAETVGEDFDDEPEPSPEQDETKTEDTTTEPETPPDPEEEDYAKILGLVGNYTPEDAKSAYRILIAQYHPDKVALMGDEIREVAERKAKEINEAYEHFRRKYDL